MEKKNIHKQHRQRVRKAYLKNGTSSMNDHNIVEMLLFYGIPYKDTNEIAHELIEKFGDLNGVLDAPYEELLNTNGIGENAATLIRLTHDIAEKYNLTKTERKTELGAQTRIEDFLAMKYMGELNEIAYMILVDSRGRLEKCVKITEGDQTVTSINKRDLVKLALIHNARDILLAHNHPRGFAVPSAADVQSTKEIVSLLRTVGVNVCDHIIVAENESFSMASNEKFKDIFIL